MILNKKYKKLGLVKESNKLNFNSVFDAVSCFRENKISIFFLMRFFEIVYNINTKGMGNLYYNFH